MPNSSRTQLVKSRVDPEIKSELETVAAEYGTDTSALIRGLLLMWLAKPGSTLPEGPWQGAGATRPEAAAHR
jgi:hypothetical protein